MKTIIRIFAAAVCGLLIAVSASAQSPTVRAIKAGRLIDTMTGKVLENQIIIIEVDKIKAVGPNLPIPTGAEVIDLSRMTVMPGFTDSHVPITGQAGGE